VLTTALATTVATLRTLRLDGRMAGPPRDDEQEELVPLVVVGGRAALLDGSDEVAGPAPGVFRRAAELEQDRHPRWAVFSAVQALRPLAAAGVTVGRVWDVAEAHRITNGGWAADPGLVWATVTGLPTGQLPARPAEDLFDFVRAGTVPPDPAPDSPVGQDGYLRPEALDPGWAASDERVLECLVSIDVAAGETAPKYGQKVRVTLGE